MNTFPILITVLYEQLLFFFFLKSFYKVPYEIVDTVDNTSTIITSLSNWPAEANEVKATRKKRYVVKEPMVHNTLPQPTIYMYILIPSFNIMFN